MKTQLAFTIHEMAWLIDNIADDLLRTCLGISFSTGRFPMIASEHEPCSQRELADYVWVSPAAVTKALPSLVQQGWVVIQVDPKQPRRNFVSLTEAGRKMAASCRAVLELEFQTLLETSGVDLGSVTKAIQSIHSALYLKAGAQQEAQT